MKFIAKIIRNGISRAFYRQNTLASTALSCKLDSPETQPIPSAITLNCIQTAENEQTDNEFYHEPINQFKPRGLLELVDAEGVSFRNEMGDFAKMDSEHFVHALHFTKPEIDQSVLNLNDIRTTFSHTIENISPLYNRSILSEMITFEEQISQCTISSEEEPISLQEIQRQNLLEKHRNRILRPSL